VSDTALTVVAVVAGLVGAAVVAWYLFGPRGRE
jgi:hypothetical protein